MEDKKDALTTKGSEALAAAPDYITKGEKGNRGFEDTLQTDLMIPRLALAQNGSPQVTEGDPSRIAGCTVGDLFNSVTGQVYGREVHIQLLRKMPLRAMEFRSIDDGGGVIDPDVPLGDPRLKWGTTGDKKKDRPAATLFRDFIAVVLPQREIIALSFKSSGIKAAKELWGLATMRNRDVHAGRYVITTGTKLTPKPHQIYKVANDGWVTKEEFEAGDDMMQAVQAINASKIHHDAADDAADDVDSFTPADIEGRGAGM